MTEQLIDILSAPGLGGSPRGLSYFKALMKCPRSAKLRAQYPDLDSSGDGEKLNALKVGTHLHTLLELYHGRILSPKWADGCLSSGGDMGFAGTDINQAEAFRLYRAYTDRVREEEWGKVKAVEYSLPSEDNEIRRVESIVLSKAGLDVTGRLDMVTEIDEERANALLTTWGLFVLPGTYIVDYKTAGARFEASMLEHEDGLQFKLYPMMYEALTGIRVQGTIVVRVFKYKVPVIEPIIVDYPSEDDKQVVYDYLKHAQFVETSMPNRAIASACFSENRVCPWYKNKMCDRKGE